MHQVQSHWQPSNAKRTGTILKWQSIGSRLFESEIKIQQHATRELRQMEVRDQWDVIDQPLIILIINGVLNKCGSCVTLCVGD
jgi:hypothetical protein